VFPRSEWEGRRQQRIRNVHLMSDTDRTLQEEQVFNQVHLEQEEG